MQTIVILLDPGKLINPDLDLRYLIPDRIMELTDGAIQDNGYDYIDREGSGPLLGIWLETGDAAQSWPAIAKLFMKRSFPIMIFPFRQKSILAKRKLRTWRIVH